MWSRSIARTAQTALLLVALLAAAAGGGDRRPERGRPAAPDLQIEWIDRADGDRPAGPLRGRPGDLLTVGLLTRNLGARPAFAMVLEAHTAMGRHGRPWRIQPGPATGRTVSHDFDLTLARGMRKLCVTARLQLAESGDPDDPNPDNDRICRPIELVSQPAGEARPDAREPE